MKFKTSPPVLLYRIGNFFFRNKVPFLPNFITYLNRLLFSVFLSSKTKIGKNFRLGYWGLGIVIHEDTIIGDNCLISQNVTIGRNFKQFGVPEIGDNVYVGSGSIIFGEIKIEDNVIIGSNSLINKSIIKNSTVVGNPMKIIESDRKESYFQLNIKNK